jgi:hypothetical protein
MINKNKKQEIKCKHKWRRGSWIGGFKGKRIVKIYLNIICEKCGKRVKVKW